MGTEKLNLGKQTAFFALNDYPQRIDIIKPDNTTEPRYMLGTLVIIPPVVEIGDRTPLALGPMRGAMENAIDECLRECEQFGPDCELHEGHRRHGQHDLLHPHGHGRDDHPHEQHVCAFMKGQQRETNLRKCEAQYQPNQTLGGTVLEVYKCKGYGLRKNQLGSPQQTTYEKSYQ